ncbi:low molecular weight phosphatase family protein [Flavobacterium reichenbachii]|uniref:Protein tyrosine phosphatase n=1 Tax=Flavobacterium reichenbachii TaxID=362418 RepID=A0A085ZI87_9FLAO|nr:protein-tyrosine-phosphatase [Flavobacterium reichenbachii]KFF04151.1 protein tyrosine phosphatase [Flavobacterium reichenbachii]OXB15803.1 protein-tyrosine-phosphatase [Flavobacterium reichenbachii]
MLYPKIENTISSFNFEQISEERKSILQPLVDFIQNKANNKKEIRLNLICTHNSRRSHLSQVWAQTAAFHYNIKNVFCYSGGTEATALFPIAAETLVYSGFKIVKISEGKNPVYSIKFSSNEAPIIGFSKTYDDDFNPESEFAAIMTCSQADGGCPFIAGAIKRIPITFEDPKVSDGTPQQKEIYLQRSLQIGTEMFYVFSQIKR